MGWGYTHSISCHALVGAATDLPVAQFDAHGVGLVLQTLDLRADGA